MTKYKPLRVKYLRSRETFTFLRSSIDYVIHSIEDYNNNEVIIRYYMPGNNHLFTKRCDEDYIILIPS